MKSLFILLTSLFIITSNIAAAHITTPVMEELVYKIRDPNTDRKDFRRSMKKIGEFIGIEIAKELDTKEKKITTILNEEATHNVIDENIVIITIFRAGIPLFDGLLEIFPNAEAGFFAMSRNEKTLEATAYYQALPPIKGKTVIIADPMVATCGSLKKAIATIQKLEPKKIILAAALAGESSIETIKQLDSSITIHVAAVDPIVNDIGYIVPGLGDAGDRSYGMKTE
jgi:uracil phosphoribosyltransferase